MSETEKNLKTYNNLVEMDDSAVDNLKIAAEEHEDHSKSDDNIEPIEEAPEVVEGSEDVELTEEELKEFSIGNDEELDDIIKKMESNKDEILGRDILKLAFQGAGLGLSAEDSDSLIDLLVSYQKDKSIKLYDEMPTGMKVYVDSLYNQIPKRDANGRPSGISKEGVARYFIDSFLSDAAFENALNQLNEEIDSTIADADSDIKKIFDDAYTEIFDNIEEVRKEDPEKANKLEEIRDAFERAKTFDSQLEYLNNDKPRNVRKYAIRFNDVCYSFNKIVNSADIKMPDVSLLADIIKRFLPDYSTDQIRKFVVLLAKSLMDLDYTNLANTAYAYRLLDSVYKFKFVKDEDNDEAKEVFSGIASVIEAIETCKKGGN